MGRICRFAILLSLLAATIRPSQAILYSDNMAYGIYTGELAARALASDTTFCSSFEAVGQIQYLLKNAKGIYEPYGGTGTIIANPNDGTQWVLTAAHLWDQSVINMTFTINNTTYAANISSRIQHPNWNSAPPPLASAAVGVSQGWDVALFRLSDLATGSNVATTGIAPATLYTSNQELGKIGYTVGFGRIGNGTSASELNTSNYKLAMANVIDRVTTQGPTVFNKYPGGNLVSDFDSGYSITNTLSAEGCPATLSSPGLPTTVVPVKKLNPAGTISSTQAGSDYSLPDQVSYIGGVIEGGTAQGDSGGPTFIWDNGNYKIAGITSWGFNPARINSLEGYLNGYYGDLTYMTRASQQAAWINEKMIQSGPAGIFFNPTNQGTSFSGTNWASMNSFGSRVALSGSNTYTGGTIISGGTLEVTNSSALGTGSVTVADGELFIDAGVDIPNAITVTGSTAIVTYNVLSGEDLATTVNVTSSLGGRDTSAVILSGTASQDGNIISGFNDASDALNDNLRISDVFTLSGVPVVEGSKTDTFTLELFSFTPVDNSAFIAWLAGDGSWVNAVNGNIGGTATFVAGAWAAAYGLGTYGVDIDTNTVWAVLNHNSDFAMIPEPGTFALVVLGFGCLLACRRSRRRPRDTVRIIFHTHMAESTGTRSKLQ